MSALTTKREEVWIQGGSASGRAVSTDIEPAKSCPVCGEAWERVLVWYGTHKYDVNQGIYETPMVLGWKPSCSCSGLVLIGDQPDAPRYPHGGSGLGYAYDFTLWQLRLNSWYQQWESLHSLYEKEPVIATG